MTCGIGLTVFDKNALKTSYSMAWSQQNRGWETYGITFLTDRTLTTQKVRGPISNFLNLISGIKTKTDTAIVHGRYSTSSIASLRNAGPIHVGNVSLAHNGTIANYKEVRKPFLQELKTDVDTEPVAHIFNDSQDYFEAFEICRKRIIGSYNFTGINDRGDCLVLRDPKGFQPLYIAEVDNEKTYVAASQDLSFRTAGYLKPEIREVKPGEIIKIDREGNLEKEEHPDQKLAECPFEKSYFLREGCVKDGELVNDLRRRLGDLMGRNENVDGIVVPVLRSGTDYALGHSKASGLPYVEALARTGAERLYMVTNKRIKNSFLSKRERLGLKHTPIVHKIKGKKILVTEDSIVTGDTSKFLTQRFKEAGASEVHWRVDGFPPVIFPCLYGKDHNIKRDLIAARCAAKLFGKDFGFDKILKYQNKLEDLVAKEIGADSVRYPNFEDWSDAFNGLDGYCQACFSGRYPSPIPEEQKINFKI